MKCFKFMTMILLVATLAVIACDDGGSGGGGTGDIAVSFVSAEQTGGTSGTTESTGLTLTFDVDPTTLTADDITVTGATKGVLSGAGLTRTLDISNITLTNGSSVSVSITSPSGYAITGTPKTAMVYRFLSDAGEIEIYIADSFSFSMSYVPGDHTFPTGIDDAGKTNPTGTANIPPTATVTEDYLIAETEVTYELWAKAYRWATGDTDMDGVIEAGETAGDYTFTFTSGREPRAGNDGTPGDETTSHEPVTYVNWRHAMVWCNALTEWYNANNGTSPDLDCVFYTDSGFTTPLRAADDSETIIWDAGSTYSGTEDEPFVDAGADGFRLPTSNEWELAARWRTDSTNTVSGYSDPWFTKGNSASDATADYTNNETTFAVGVFYYYFNSNSTGVNSTASVKSKLANSLGLYDISGNVYEWCFDWYPGYEGSSRARRGGCWVGGADTMQVGYGGIGRPYDEYNYVGFRFARSAP